MTEEGGHYMNRKTRPELQVRIALSGEMLVIGASRAACRCGGS